MTITDFLLARIAEDEAAARAAAESASPAMFPDPSIPGPVWEAHDGMVAGPPDGDGFVTSLWDDEGSEWLRMHPDAARHIARHDPARVLAECAAKRAILEMHQPTLTTVEWFDDATGTGHARICPSCRPDDPTDWHPPIGMAGIRPEGFVPHYTLSPCPTLRALAAVYKDHPDYQQEWA